ncbi:MAG: SusD/RagB family nutrient-binding outer membrane lipoprotein [Bacteroidota bacterium]
MKKILSIILVLGIMSSCTKDFTELNTDLKNPTEVPGEPLFTHAVRNLVDQMQSSSVNRNVFRLYSQYWAQTTYPDESQYNMVTRNIPDNMWSTYYKDVLKDLDESAIIIEATEYPPEEPAAVKTNKLAAIELMTIYTYAVLVDTYGDVPYTDALDSENVLPTYDPAKDVYYDLISRLDAVIGQFDDSASGFSANADLVYYGDTEAWIKFANSLKLRLAMRIADYDDTKASAMVAGVDGKVFESNLDNFSMEYFGESPNTNPLNVSLVQSGRYDFVGSNTLIDLMNTNNDPRRALWFSEEEGEFVGGIYGSANSYGGNSNMGNANAPGALSNPSLRGVLLSYSEVSFLLAEAAERGYTVTGSAEDNYMEGIKASINEWGGSEADFEAYYAQTEVAYASATGDYKQKIGIQQWIAQFNQGFDGWCTWRRLDFTGFNPIETGEPTPTRFIYPTNEHSLNGSNWEAAAANYEDDSKTAKVFWDVN